ncbi:MAG: phosphatidate cytidylyltransferase [Planctomycetota bacterium]|nr:phosphatidate cytidylyltransferase [Planctomycetota bacterium]MBU6276562.1 phosphatidate cytidylyltransferase [Planctomycetota bacterium]
MNDLRTAVLVTGVLGLLAVATAVGQFLARRTDRGLDQAAIRAFNQRLRGWWIMSGLLAAACWLGVTATVTLFGLLSFWALREFITLTPTRRGDHRALFWVFVLFTPVHYVLVAYNRYDVFSVFLPVYATLFVMARVAFTGDYTRFLERTAKIQAGLVVCVYCVSFAPALLQIKTAGSPPTGNFPLLFFLVLLVQFADASQRVWSRLLGRHLVAADVSSVRTWEGLVGSATCTAALGAALWWFAPPYGPWQAALAGLVIALLGFAGGMTMAAIKRDRGVSDHGTLVVGHGGVLDRIDSLCFAAPVFYHLTLALAGPAALGNAGV